MLVGKVAVSTDESPKSKVPNLYASAGRVLLRPLTNKGGLRGLIRHCRDIGVRQALRRSARECRRAFAIALDRRFDRRHGVDTVGFIPPKRLPVDSESKVFSHEYGPTPEKSFRNMLKSVKIDFSEYSFIDYGSGKGRTVLIAAEHPFRAVVGIEYSDALAQIGRDNIRRYRNGKLSCRQVDSLTQDAMRHQPPEGPCLFFLFSPFFGEVLQGVLDNIAASYRDDPRPMVILYCEESGSKPIPHELFAAIDSMQQMAAPSLPRDFGAARQIIYTVYANAEARRDWSGALE